MSLTDAELKLLLLRGVAGDGLAHRAFLVGASGLLRTFFRARIRSAAEDVEDLLQETLIALHIRRASFDPAFPVKAWIYAIARYRMIDLWRRRGRQGTQISIEDTAELYTSAEDTAIDSKRDVMRLLDTLPRKQRDSIRLVKLEGVSIADAAMRMGLSESDVKISGHRGIRTLMKRMAEAPT